MRRIMILLGFAATLGACSNEKVADYLNTSTGRVAHPNTILPLTGLILSTPPVNTILFGHGLPARRAPVLADPRLQDRMRGRRRRPTPHVHQRVAADGRQLSLSIRLAFATKRYR